MPAWSKSTHYRHTYNARTETLNNKPSFKPAWQQLQLCAVPVYRFFEPYYGGGKAQNWQIQRKDGEPFYLAGLWQSYADIFGDAVHSFTLLTINATGHPIMGYLHGPEDEKRSVVVLPNDCVEEWLAIKNTSAAEAFFVLFNEQDFCAQRAA
jgi:putative SOS response-associated peptidase YedK